MSDKVEFKLELSEEARTALYQLADKAGMSADEYLESILWKYVNNELSFNDDSTW